MKPQLKTLDNTPVDGKVVFLRVDFNVSVGLDGKMGPHEDYRIRSALPTIRELQQRRCRILLATHRGEAGENQDVAPLRHRLEDLLGEEIVATRHLYGDEVKAKLSALEPGGIVFLPNVRSDPREEALNEQFARQLSEAADAYVNEAFSVCHREHASVALVPRLLPSCAGQRVVEEVSVLERLRSAPGHPYVAVLSGSKIATKEKLLRKLLAHVDRLCIGGQLANVMLAAQGKYKTSRFAAEEVELAKNILAEAGDRIILPLDVVVGAEDGRAETVSVCDTSAIPEDAPGVWDIGPKTVQLFSEECRAAQTVLWNGPLGRFERQAYSRGTAEFADLLSQQKNFRVLGGGETVTAIEQASLASAFDHVSVGGGALIQFLEDGPMPGLAPLYA